MFNNTPKDSKSDIGRFLSEFDKKPEASNKAREQEIQKHGKIKQLRDNISEK